METEAAVRIDKWLWAVRLFKTRTLAADACRGGDVRLGGARIKPSHIVKVGEVYTVRKEDTTRTVRVVGLIEQRVGAVGVADLMEDLTPASESEKRRESSFRPALLRERGAGRPTKKDRRDIGRMLGDEA